MVKYHGKCKKMAQKNPFTYIDLFAGAGGLSEGFLKAGFLPVAHVEMVKDACDTLKTRLAYHHLKKAGAAQIYRKYLRGKLSREMFYNSVPDEVIQSVLNYHITLKNADKVVEDIRASLQRLGESKVDVIIGGPPCQAYSLAGRSADKDGMKGDARNYLYQVYGKFLLRFKPKMFIFENVPGLLSADGGTYFKNLKKYFRRLGYSLEDSVLDAAQFGVIQRRKRIIIIGWKKELNFKYPDFKTVKFRWRVRHLLSDLPCLKPGETSRVAHYVGRANTYLQRFNLRNGMGFVTQHITRPHNKKDLKIYKLAIKTWEKNKKRLKNGDVPKGMRTQKNIDSFRDRFKVVASNELCHTMIAHIAKDGHYYIHPDKNQLRSLSVREAARIQSFPDDYFFEGTRSSAFRQIGNAVPPLMAEAIARKMRDTLGETN